MLYSTSQLPDAVLSSVFQMINLRTTSKRTQSMVGVKASNGNPQRPAATGGLEDGERAGAPPGGSADAGAAATDRRDDGERAPAGGPTDAGGSMAASARRGG